MPSNIKTLRNDTDVVVPKAGETYVADDGTVSQVLDDHIDANYEPTEAEVLEFAEWIGMKLPEDSEFLWLAREGLKTPLPKEWKPCSTDDGEVYYFNFKTGDSSWDHPMDGIFRQRFAQEKQKSELNKGVSARAAAATAKGSGGLSTSNLSNSGSTSAIKQTHVMVTDTGVLRRDTGPGLAGKPVLKYVPNDSSKGESEGVSSGKRREESTAALHHQPHQKQTSVRGGVDSPARSMETPAAALTGMGTSTITSESEKPIPKRIMSEAERALEERVQREMQQKLEAERAKAEDAHQAAIAALQANHDKEVADLRSADAARRTTSIRQEEEEREQQLQQTRTSCEEKYGDELRTLEREAETLSTKLQKLEAEANRVKAGNSQRLAIEAEAKKALTTQIAEVETRAKKQHEESLAALNADHRAAIDTIRKEEQNKLKDAQQTRQKKLDSEERTMALQTEKERQKLEIELKELDQQLTAAVAVANQSSKPESAATSQMSSTSLNEQLARLAESKTRQLREVEMAATREQSEVRLRGEQTLAHLDQQLKQPTPLLSSSDASLSGSLAATADSDRPAISAAPAGMRSSPAARSVAYTEGLNRIRLSKGKERQDLLSKLRAERERALSVASESSSSTFADAMEKVDGNISAAAEKMRTSDCVLVATVEALKAAHAAEAEAAKTLYARLEEDLKQQCQKEASEAVAATSAEEQSRLVEGAIEAEMAIYIQEMTARHERMRAEAATKREKALADHRLAMEAYERTKQAVESRATQREQEAKKAFIQERLDVAEAAEKTKLATDHAAVTKRLLERYDEERDALKAEVEEEMSAFETAERQKMSASGAGCSVPNSKNGEVAADQAKEPLVASRNADALTLSATCEKLSKKLSDRSENLTSTERTQAALLATLEQKQASLKEQHQRLEQRVHALKRENTDLAVGVRATASRMGLQSPSTCCVDPTPNAIPIGEGAKGVRLRSAHEAAIHAIEEGYRAQQRALEEELLTWRGKTRAVLQGSHLTLPLPSHVYSPTDLSTPQQRASEEATQTGSSSRQVASVPRLFYQHSPIPVAPAGPSLQSTPFAPRTFDGVPWEPSARPSAPPVLAGQLSLALRSRSPSSILPGGPTAAASSTNEAILISEHSLRNIQQRQASLQAAREAWQLQRQREIELQQQAHLMLHQQRQIVASAGGIFGEESRGGGYTFDSNERGPHREELRGRRREQLSRSLSFFGERLDALTGRVEELRNHRPHRRGRSAIGVDLRSEAKRSAIARSRSAGPPTLQAGSQHHRDPTSATSGAIQHRRPALARTTASAKCEVHPTDDYTSIHVSRNSRDTTTIQRADVRADVDLPAKWKMLLSERPRKHRNR